MAYAEVDVITDGALDDSRVFGDDDTVIFEQYLMDIETEAREHGLLTEVYILWHEHDDTGEECACIQYVQDHNPIYTFNQTEEN